ncbi:MULTISPECIES: hypothetical protein [unclassified Clostridium]|uniref:hypothetical protein n=1 Tax=unclassified Clostridium TaxID=2614128 RepID=UPI002079F388|nr:MULTISPECIES: hypothetical protein [unclassified Clostridium]
MNLKIKGYKIDENGFYIEDYIYQEDEQLEDNIITTDIPQGLYIPKWNGSEWVEGATQEYIESIKPKPKELTETEILQKQLLETQNMLLELQYKLTNKDLTNNLK